MSLEQRLRKHEGIIGTPIELGNGERWLIPSLPITCDFEDENGELKAKPRGVDGETDKLLDMIDEIEKVDSVPMSKGFEFMIEILKLNYKDLTPDTTKGLLRLDQYKQFFEALLLPDVSKKKDAKELDQLSIG